MAETASPSNANVRDVLRKLMRDQNYDPFKELIRIAKDPDSNLKLRADIASDLAKYIAPQLKGIDIDAKASGSIQIVIQRFAEEILSDDPKTIDVSPVLGLSSTDSITEGEVLGARHKEKSKK